MKSTKHAFRRTVVTVFIVMLALSQAYMSVLADSGPPWAESTLDNLSYTER